MNKRLAVVVAFTLFLSLVIVKIPARAQTTGTIVINFDGAVTGTNNIQQVGSTYTLTGNINSQIEVELDNIVIDGAGFTLTEPSINTTGVLVIPTGGFPELDLNSRTNVTIKNLNIKGSISGITIQDSSNVQVDNCTLQDCSNISLTVIRSDNITISENTIANNYQGIEIIDANYTSITANTIGQNNIGVFCYASNLPPRFQSGALSSCSYIDIIGNNIQANAKYGIGLSAPYYTRIEYNIVENNGNGISLYPSYYVIVYQNNIVNNNPNLVTDNGMSSGGGNTWIWNSSSVGNYWSDYLTKYPNATEVGASGTGNTPYVIDPNNIDYYPLINMININPPYSTIDFSSLQFINNSSSPTPNSSSTPTPTSNPTVPEFPTVAILFLIIFMASVGLLVYFKRSR